MDESVRSSNTRASCTCSPTSSANGRAMSRSAPRLTGWCDLDESNVVTGLLEGDIPYVESGADVSAGYVAADGTWVPGLPRRWSCPIRGSSAVQPPQGPTARVDDRPEPIITPGPTGSQDSGGLQWPSVVGPTRAT